MKFSTKIIHWYKRNKRNLPWRNTNDPYKIWLSEIILQQTRIDQGVNYYLKFCDKYPDINSLAKAEEEQILKLWQGLGYYSRARNVHKTARLIMDKYHGQFPDNYSDIINLKGIGEYTAAAIISFAFNQVYPVVDGNVMRLISRIYGIKTAINNTKGKNEIYTIAQKLIDKNQPGEFNQAIMEFGALHCKPQNPDCKSCIFKLECVAFQQDLVPQIPFKINNIKIRKRYFHYFLLMYNGQIILNKRTANDIWQNLYDFPHIESVHFLGKNGIEKEFSNQFNISEDLFQIIKPPDEYKHILTHQRIFARFYTIKISDENSFQKIKSLNNNQYISIKYESIHLYPLPRLVDKFLTEN